MPDVTLDPTAALANPDGPQPPRQKSIEDILGPEKPVAPPQQTVAQQQITESQSAPQEPYAPKQKLVSDVLGPGPSAFDTTMHAVHEVGRSIMNGELDPEAHVGIDSFMDNTVAGRYMKNNIEGLQHGWEGGDTGAGEAVAYLKQLKVFGEKDNVVTNVLNGFSKAITEPLALGATALDLAARSAGAAFGGAQAVFGGAASEIERQAEGMEKEHPYIAAGLKALGGAVRVPAALMEANPEFHGMGIPGETAKKYMPTKDAIDLGVLKSEAEFHGLPPADPNEVPALVKKQDEAAHPPAPKAPESVAINAEREKPAAPDIHQVARQVDPVTFNKWDPLQARLDSYRSFIEGLKETRQQQAEAQAPHAEAIQLLNDQIQEIQEAKKGGFGKVQSLIKKHDALAAERQAFIDDFTSHYTPDMQRVQKALIETDEAMRDLAPQVSAAYREAQSRLPPSGVEGPKSDIEQALSSPNATAPHEAESAQPEPGTAEAVRQAVSEGEKTPEAAQAEAAQKAAGVTATGENKPLDVTKNPSQTTPEHVKSIEDDLTQKLITAGRPEEEARSSAAIVAQSFKTLANMFGGKLGNAFDLYKKEISDVIGRAGPLTKKGIAAKIKEFMQEAWHGSPHIFDAFHLKHIGRGEGAQVYGHGLYFASLKKIGGWYRDKLSKAATDGYKKDGKLLSVTNAYKDINSYMQKTLHGDALEEWRDYWRDNQHGFDLSHAIDDSIAGRDVKFDTAWENHWEDSLKDYLKKFDVHSNRTIKSADGTVLNKAAVKQRLLDAIKESGFVNTRGEDFVGSAVRMATGEHFKPEEIISSIEDEYKNYRTGTSRQKAAYAIIKEVSSWDIKDQKPGRLYKVEIPEHDQFLDWDKPLSEQPKNIKDAIDKLSSEENVGIDHDMTGKDIVEHLTDAFGSPEEASNALYDYGIKGNAYLDASSRGNIGQGSHNYVLFSHDDVTIKDYEQSRNAARGGERVVRGRSSFFNGTALIELFKEQNASTFMHEMGHAYLEMMHKYAEHPDAPAQLKADLETVHDWLGVKDWGSLTNKQLEKAHEKWARGFEQYLRIGVAPTKALARAFENFKQWLTSIYKKTSELGKNITPEIRQVMDRIIGTEEHEAVIAPDQTPAKTFADLHEVDAKNTPPSQAKAGADIIDDERHRIIRQEFPDAADQIIDEQGRAAGGPSEQPAGAAEHPATAEAGQPGSSQAGAAQESGKVSPVVGGAEEEGAGLRQQPDAGAVEAPGNARPPGRAGGVQPPDHPNAEFEPSGGDLVDKAGNIRLDNLNEPEQLKEIYRTVAKENNDFWDARGGGVIPDAMRIEASELLGIDPYNFTPKKPPNVSWSTWIECVKRTSIKAAADVYNASTEFSKFKDQASFLKYEEAKARMKMIQEEYSHLTAEWGRGGRALHKPATSIAELKQILASEMDPKSFEQSLVEAQFGAKLKTPAQASKWIAATRKPSFKDMIVEYYINNLVSGPITHMGYFVHNELLALSKTAETFIAGIQAEARERLTGVKEDDRVYMGEAKAQLFGMMQGAQRGLPAALEALRTNELQYLPGEKFTKVSDALNLLTDKDIKSLPDDHIRALNNAIEELQKPKPDLLPTDQAAKLKSLLEDIRDNKLGATSPTKIAKIKDALDLLRNPELQMMLGEDAPDVYDLNERFALQNFKSITGANVEAVLGRSLSGGVKQAIDVAGEAVRLPGRPIQAIHAISRHIAYAQELHSLAYREAAKQGLEGRALANEITRIIDNPSPEMMRKAADEATKMALMQRHEFGSATSLIGRLTNASLVGKIIVPFVSVVSNVLHEGLVQRTPLGLFSKEIRENLSGANGAVARDTQRAKLILGTMMSSVIVNLWANDNATGGGPTDPNEGRMWIEAGYQPYSVKIGGHWIPYRGGPIGEYLSVMTEICELTERAHDDDDFLHAVGATLTGVTKAIMDESWMRGIADMVGAVDNFDAKGARWAGGLIANFAVPYSVGMGQIARATDTYMREARTTLDMIKARIPVVAEMLIPKIGIWGQPIDRHATLSVNGPIKPTDDPLTRELYEVGFHPSKLPRQIQGIDLTDQQYHDYAVLSGQLARRIATQMVNHPAWREFGSGDKVLMIRHAFTAARQNAAQSIMLQSRGTDNDIIQQAAQNKLDLHKSAAQEAME